MPNSSRRPLSRLHETVTATGASHVVTLINRGTLVERPSTIVPERHLLIDVSDIVEPLEGHILPAAEHVAELLTFARAWGREKPLVFHCFAGISRSTRQPTSPPARLRRERGEAELALDLRRASPTATPNSLFVALADDMLGRRGRIVEAIREIRRGAEAMDGIPFM